MGYTKY